VSRVFRRLVRGSRRCLRGSLLFCTGTLESLPWLLLFGNSGQSQAKKTRSLARARQWSKNPKVTLLVAPCAPGEATYPSSGNPRLFGLWETWPSGLRHPTYNRADPIAFPGELGSRGFESYRLRTYIESISGMSSLARQLRRHLVLHRNIDNFFKRASL
jgi:hypothetical protein